MRRWRASPAKYSPAAWTSNRRRSAPHSTTPRPASGQPARSAARRRPTCCRGRRWCRVSWVASSPRSTRPTWALRSTRPTCRRTSPRATSSGQSTIWIFSMLSYHLWRVELLFFLYSRCFTEGYLRFQLLTITLLTSCRVSDADPDELLWIGKFSIRIQGKKSKFNFPRPRRPPPPRPRHLHLPPRHPPPPTPTPLCRRRRPRPTSSSSLSSSLSSSSSSYSSPYYSSVLVVVFLLVLVVVLVLLLRYFSSLPFSSCPFTPTPSINQNTNKDNLRVP